MHDAVYPNPCAPAQTAQALQLAKQAAATKPIQVMPNNSLSLLPEHLSFICFTWIAHMAKQRMPPNCMRVLNAIFNQTLGFKKRQDDMAGTRLQQLTYIRADHANHAVRVLEQEHAVITYKGRYGKWLSINFEFESWGKKKKIKQRHYNNDPQCLLPDYYSEEPIDAGLSIGYDDDGIDESLDLSASINSAIVQQTTASNAARSMVVNTQTNTSNPVDNGDVINTQACVENTVTSHIDTGSNTENVATSDINHAPQISENTQLNERILEKLQQFEDKIQGIEQQLNHTQTHTHEIINQTISAYQQNINSTASTTTYTDSNNAQTQTENHYNNSQIDHDNNYQSATERDNNNYNNQATIEGSQPANQIENTHHSTQSTTNSAAHDAQSSHHTPQNSSQNGMNENAANGPKLQYPSHIESDLQPHFNAVLSSTGNDAQAVLNLLAKRMQNTHDPIINPKAYLSGLVQRYQKGELDLSSNTHNASSTTQNQTPVAPQLSEKEAHIQALKAEYQDAHEDYQHIKRNMHMLHNPEKESFDEYVESQSLDMQTLWYKIQTRLADAYDELEAAMQKHEAENL